VKKLEAIIKPFKLEEVKEALAELGIEGITVCEVKGYQPMNGAPVGSAHLSDLHPKFKVEVVIPSNLIDRAVRSVLAAARTGLALPISVDTMALNITAPPPHRRSRLPTESHGSIDMTYPPVCVVCVAARRARMSRRVETPRHLAARTRARHL